MVEKESRCGMGSARQLNSGIDYCFSKQALKILSIYSDAIPFLVAEF